MYNEGISKVGNIVYVGVKESIVQKSGAWFSYNDIRLGPVSYTQLDVYKRQAYGTSTTNKNNKI